jgi:cytochrome o ubiquinol oxidase subunit 3
VSAAEFAAGGHADARDVEGDAKAIFGFWVYLMTDCVLFAGLFATYAVLRDNTFGGPAGYQIFNMPQVLVETLVLLMSSFTCGLGVLAARSNRKTLVLGWFAATFVLGLVFLTIELTDFHSLVTQGNSWTRSGFLSAYFTLVGTHGLHITIGLLWMAVLVVRIRKTGLTRGNVRRLTLLSLFWHFLDLVWIFIFTIVYLMGAARV